MSAFDASPQIEQGVTDPASAASDGVSVTAKPIEALILADQYLAQKVAACKPHRGVRMTRLIGPPQHAGHPFPREGY